MKSGKGSMLCQEKKIMNTQPVGTHLIKLLDFSKMESVQQKPKDEPRGNQRHLAAMADLTRADTMVYACGQ